MQPQEAWGARWSDCANPLAHRYMETAVRKQSLVCLAADMRTVGELVDLVNSVGPHIAALKTHADMVDDFSRESWQRLVDAAQQHDLFPDVLGSFPRFLHGFRTFSNVFGRFRTVFGRCRTVFKCFWTCSDVFGLFSDRF